MRNRFTPYFQPVLGVLLILLIITSFGCSTVVPVQNAKCSVEFSEPEMVKLCEMIRKNEKRRQQDEFFRDMENMHDKHRREHDRVMDQHKRSVCIPNHATGGCL